jgi:hypothetical protein
VNDTDGEWVSEPRPSVFEYVGPPLDRQRLHAILEANGVHDRAYDLSGASKSMALTLEQRTEGWVIFSSEHGEKDVLARHATEADACLDLLYKLLADRSDRRRR